MTEHIHTSSDRFSLPLTWQIISCTLCYFKITLPTLLSSAVTWFTPIHADTYQCAFCCASVSGTT